MIYRRALSLDQVLTSAAIVSVLAAILFPVLAARRISDSKDDAAKNARRIAAGAFMYSVGYDDYAMPITTWGDRDAPVNVGGIGMKAWTYLISPYTKADWLLDPRAQPYTPFGGTWSEATTIQMQPQFGYNSYTYDIMFSGSQVTQQVIQWSTPVHPEKTAAFVSKNSRAEVIGLAGPAAFYWFGTRTFSMNMYVQPPWCNPTDPSYCTYWWGDTYLAQQFLARREAAGAFTGSASMRGADKTMVIAWGDGHVSSERWQKMAEGTNVHQNSPGVWAYGDNGVIVINDISKYLWDAQ